MKRLLILCLSLSLFACDSFLDIEPDGKVIPETLEDFRGLLTQAYVSYPTHKSLIALRTDELDLDRNSLDFMDLRDIYTWKDQGQDKQTVEFPWIRFYNSIFYANHIITEGSNRIEQSSEKDQLLAEAYALRAYAFFDLANLYAKPYNVETASSVKAIPLVLDIDLEKIIAPSSLEETYFQIHSDLKESMALMQRDSYDAGLNYRFSKAAIYALEARVYLYQQNWVKAWESAQKSLEINNQLQDYNAEDILASNFTSKESIMALEQTFSATIKRSSTASETLISAFDKEEDLRFERYFEVFRDSYKVINVGELENKVSFRTSELYFIQAEALVRQGSLTEAIESLEPILTRRYTTDKSQTLIEDLYDMDNSSFLDFLFEERYREFALEGHRWFDLRRYKQIEIEHHLNDETFYLFENDPRYTLPYPETAKQNNPYL